MENDTLPRMLLHLGRLSPDQVEYEGRLVSQPPPSNAVVIGWSFFRRFSCIVGCPCCQVDISLDYISPMEIRPPYGELFMPRQVHVNGRGFTIYSARGGETSPDGWCRFVDRSSGGPPGPCQLWQEPGSYRPPSECSRVPQVVVLMSRRGHALLQKRAIFRAWKRYPVPLPCKFEEVKNVLDMGLENDIDRLQRMQAWADFFEIKTGLPRIIEHLQKVRAGQEKPGYVVLSLV